MKARINGTNRRFESLTSEMHHGFERGTPGTRGEPRAHGEAQTARSTGSGPGAATAAQRGREQR